MQSQKVALIVSSRTRGSPSRVGLGYVDAYATMCAHRVGSTPTASVRTARSSFCHISMFSDAFKAARGLTAGESEAMRFLALDARFRQARLNPEKRHGLVRARSCIIQFASLSSPRRTITISVRERSTYTAWDPSYDIHEPLSSTTTLQLLAFLTSRCRRSATPRTSRHSRRSCRAPTPADVAMAAHTLRTGVV